MNLEELKLVMETLSALGEQGKSAFIWWLLVTKIPSFLIDAGWICGVVFAVTRIVREVAAANEATNAMKGLRDWLGTGSSGWLSPSDISRTVNAVRACERSGGEAMSEINDGGPAFPVWELNGQGQQETTSFGMSMRDYFAAKALQGLLADSELRDTWGEFANSAYEIADAMLKAREGKK